MSQKQPVWLFTHDGSTNKRTMELDNGQQSAEREWKRTTVGEFCNLIQPFSLHSFSQQSIQLVELHSDSSTTGHETDNGTTKGQTTETTKEQTDKCQQNETNESTAELDNGSPGTAQKGRHVQRSTRMDNGTGQQERKSGTDNERSCRTELRSGKKDNWTTK